MKNTITKIIIDAKSLNDGETLVTINKAGEIIECHYGVGNQPDWL